MTVGEEVIDVRIKIIIENNSRDRGRQNFRRSFSNDNRDRNRTRERSLTPRGNDNRKYDSLNVNLGTRNRSNSRVPQTEIGLDVLDAGNIIILPMNVQMQSQMIQMGMN